jgi:hypothetical protein
MTYLTELIARACAIEKEAFLTLAVPKTIDAFPYYFATSEAPVYTTHRISVLPIDHSDGDQDNQDPQPRLTIRVVVGHLTDKYKGENDSIIYTYIPLLVDYLSKRRWFQTVPTGLYPAPLDELIYSEVVDAGGFMVFDNRGFAGVSQVGFELQIACTFTESIIQAYQE